MEGSGGGVPRPVENFSEADFAQTFGRTSREIIAHYWGKDRYDDAQIAELQSARRQMDATLRTWGRTLDRTPPDRQAHLLEALLACASADTASWSRRAATWLAG